MNGDLPSPAGASAVIKPAGASIAVEIPCPVCTAAVGLVVATSDRHGRPLKTIACARCGLFRTDPLPAPSHLSQFHESEYRQDYKGVRRPKLKHVFRSGQLARDRLRRLGSYLGPCANVLDAGCGSGEWLYVLGAAGHSAVGIEVDPAYAAFGCQEYGVTIRTGPVFTADMPEQEFDCITMFHVLEHLPNPVQVFGARASLA